MTLAYSTYLGGNGLDSGEGIAVDSLGAAYVTGATQSTNFPTQDPFQTDQDADDVFVTKLNPDPGGADDVTLAYSTYLGGSDDPALEEGDGIAVDSAGAAYVTGFTDSPDFPTEDAFQPDTIGHNFDAFVTKFNPDAGGAVTLAYSTYLGGTFSDRGLGIAVDAAGAAYVGGATSSPDFVMQDEFQADQETGRTPSSPSSTPTLAAPPT